MKQKYLWLLLPLLAIFVLSCGMIARELLTEKREANTFAELTARFALPEAFSEAEQASSSPDNASEATPRAPVHKRDITAMTKENPDCVGWLSIADTPVDYPVMYTPNEPQRYLRKDFYGDYSHSGTPFLDERCTLDGGSLIIYGHNMKNDAMFSTLTQYVDADYLHEHPLLELETAAGCEYYRIFAVVLAAPTDEWYDSPAASPAELETLLRHIGENALYDTGCAPLSERQLLTLSTCYYGGSGDERLLIVAYREEPNDD